MTPPLVETLGVRVCTNQVSMRGRSGYNPWMGKSMTMGRVCGHDQWTALLNPKRWRGCWATPWRTSPRQALSTCTTTNSTLGIVTEFGVINRGKIFRKNGRPMCLTHLPDLRSSLLTITFQNPNGTWVPSSAPSAPSFAVFARGCAFGTLWHHCHLWIDKYLCLPILWNYPKHRWKPPWNLGYQKNPICTKKSSFLWFLVNHG